MYLDYKIKSRRGEPFVGQGDLVKLTVEVDYVSWSVAAALLDEIRVAYAEIKDEVAE